MINELAWSGTLASAHDEWIELFNPSASTVHLDGWSLTDGDDIHISLRGDIAPHAYFLLERTNNSTIADIEADQIYTGNLENSGETLWLKDPSGYTIDSANEDGGAWPAGNSAARASMERHSSGNWGTFTGVGSAGHDAKGNPIQGTPRRVNSLHLPAPTATPLPEPTLTPTPTMDLESTPTPIPPQTILINEVAWAGTIASASDEWIELFNPGDQPISLDGWTLTDGNDVQVQLTGTITASGFFLLERTDDSTVANIAADLIYSGSLNNSGERLWVMDPTGRIIDSANEDGDSWPAGKASSHESMERRGGLDHPRNWGTHTGYHQAGQDVLGNPIRGTPLKKNSVLLPLPAPIWIPGRIRINEVLIRPHYDWEGKGGVDTGDEFIELYNLGPNKVFLKGWTLDDEEGGGSKPYKIPGITIRPGGYATFFHTKTGITLNDDGDTVRLIAPNGTLVEEIRYLKVSAYNLSYGRLPDGSGHLAYGLWPTPNEANLLYEESFIPVTGEISTLCPIAGEIRTYLVRHLRHPARIRWMRSHNYVICDRICTDQLYCLSPLRHRYRPNTRR
ncbi:MAG: hypothetical protein A2Z14_04385 [Chloroflexi bacterium RBG_16_48_8]|nr:MAG: hypothetical protein A2Z14_04385 [Chloroflexi bacterium RBG_16_48_8]